MRPLKINNTELNFVSLISGTKLYGRFDVHICKKTNTDYYNKYKRR
jgi:hypothetical protein